MGRKERVKGTVAAVFAAAIVGQAFPVAAGQIPDSCPVVLETTAYCDHGLTASGCMVRRGVCAAREDMIGRCAVIYEMAEDGTMGDFLGYYEILDTGGDYRIRNGSVIDIYMPDYDQCMEYGRRKAYVQIVEAEG